MLDVLVEVLVLGDDDWVELGRVKVKVELEVLVVTDEDDWDVCDELWDEIWDELGLLEEEPPWLSVPIPPVEAHGTDVAVVVEPNGIVRTVEHVVWDELWESDGPAVPPVAK